MFFDIIPIFRSKYWERYSYPLQEERFQMGWNLRTHTHTQKLLQQIHRAHVWASTFSQLKKASRRPKSFSNWPLGWSLPLVSCESQPLPLSPPPAAAALLPAHSVPPGRLSGRTRGAQPTTNNNHNQQILNHNQQLQHTQTTNTRGAQPTTKNCNKHNQQLLQIQTTNAKI